MKRLLLFAVVIAAMLAASCSKYKYEKVAGDPLKTRIYTLDNGLKVYMSVNKETPRIQTAIAVRVGGKNDPAQTTGLAHYFEHLMFKGTEQFGTSDYAAEKPLLDQIEALFEIYRSTTDQAERTAIYHRIDSISYEASKISIPNEYDKLMAAIGADGTNAYTSQDMTVYVEDIPANQVENWIRIQADRFKHPVIRGFHTELETVYEEKNMSLTQDSRKVWEAMDAALYPNHPYGTQTVLGTQEHLKNPSIINIKNYHKTYYVPNNMAVCVSGDFDPDQMIAAIDKHFGDMLPNKELPALQFTPEQPIEAPVVKEVLGLEAENVMLGWRLPAANDRSNDIAQIVGSLLYNGQAGLIDLNIVQQQKALEAYAFTSLQPDYGSLMLAGNPKDGQTLDQVRDLLIAETAKLCSGDFDEKLIEATINNFKMYMMQQMDTNEGRSDMFVEAFINGAEWRDEVEVLDRMSKITKDDVVAWANQYLRPESYAIVYKRQGEDPSVQKIAAPKITPIATNRDAQSAFLAEMKASEVAPIEPQFVNFETDMARFDAQSGIKVLYKQNQTNDIFKLIYVFDTGTENDPAINLAFNYLGYLGTDEMTAEQIASELYSLGCSFSLYAGPNQSWITLSGLSENMEKAMSILEKLIAGAKADEAILANLKSDQIKERTDAKLNQSRNFSALRSYLQYGPEFIARATLSTPALAELTPEQLLAKVRELTAKQHKALYYGPQGEKEVTEALAAHHKVAADPQPLEKKFAQTQLTDKNKVVLAQYDAKQLYYLQYSNRGEAFAPSNDPGITLYNEYFGSGMSSVVFQEMREARGLAYSSAAWIGEPQGKDNTYTYLAFIATQNDKMQKAIEAFDEIINEMPESEAAFNIAKESLLARLRTQRTVKENVLWSYLRLQDLGLETDRDKQIFEAIQSMTLADVKAVQQKWVKDRNYTYGILGDLKDIDLTYLKTLGPVQVVSQEDIFGY